jgi:NADP-dependent 3-hydroxy acid dehydrogenase YdfG
MLEPQLADIAGMSMSRASHHQQGRRNAVMGTERKVAVITGASQGIGAALVKA